MKSKRNSIILIATLGTLLLGLSLWTWFRAPEKYSESERRVLASFPEFTLDNLMSGSFTKDFETYTQDQFPLRDQFRTLKALTVTGLFRQSDHHDIYQADDHVSQLLYPLKESMLENASEKFRNIYDLYLADSDVNIFFSIIPDKNYVLAEASGHPALDYDKLFSMMQDKTPYMQYIDISDLLSAEDYYRTDTHWKQEQITDVADRLLEGMGAASKSSGGDADSRYTWNTLDYPFYGVYRGLSALPLKPDTILYATNEILDQCIVTSYDTGKPAQAYMYDMEAATGRDPYEMFLSGSSALITIENPAADSDRELILFRDSYASSLTPLLVESYAKITMVDIRYVQSKMLGHFIEFDDQDVLFLYSTLLLNDSMGLR